LKPKVTVGICVKNGGDVIKLALKSISKQNFPHDLMEIVIVDDGSSDDTFKTLNSFAGKTDIETRVYESGGKGLAFSRQMVVERAQGEYVVWVDADQELLQDSVEKHFDFMENNSEIVAACGNEIFRGQTLAATLESISIAFGNRASTVALDVGGGIFRLEALKKIGGFDKNLKGAGEDVEVVHRMTKAGMKAARDQSEFYHNHRKTWKALWDEYFWWGYGMHYVTHKRKNRFPKNRILPFAFLQGFFHAVRVYKMYRQKKAFLLPFQYSFKNVSWCVGYLSSHIEHHEYKG
jgi:glycosyltransferase involved in cell wall biosynthesis